jgi:hypothetical protein
LCRLLVGAFQEEVAMWTARDMILGLLLAVVVAIVMFIAIALATVVAPLIAIDVFWLRTWVVLAIFAGLMLYARGLAETDQRPK